MGVTLHSFIHMNPSKFWAQLEQLDHPKEQRKWCDNGHCVHHTRGRAYQWQWNMVYWMKTFYIMYKNFFFLIVEADIISVCDDNKLMHNFVVEPNIFLNLQDQLSGDNVYFAEWAGCQFLRPGCLHGILSFTRWYVTILQWYGIIFHLPVDKYVVSSWALVPASWPMYYCHILSIYVQKKAPIVVVVVSSNVHMRISAVRLTLKNKNNF